MKGKSTTPDSVKVLIPRMDKTTQFFLVSTGNRIIQRERERECVGGGWMDSEASSILFFFSFAQTDSTVNM